MSDRASLTEELQNLIHRLFQLPKAWGCVTGTENGDVIERIGIIRRRLDEEDDD